MPNLAEISVNDVHTRRGNKGNLTTSYVALHTVSANAAPEIVDVLVGSIDASNATTFSLMLSATGETSSTGTVLVEAEALAAKVRVRVTGIPMAAGDVLYGKAGANDDASYVISTQKERTGETAH